jgi:hypothetical protein
MTKFSHSKILSFFIGVSVFVGCQSVMAVPIYRGVDANVNTGLASLAPGQFTWTPVNQVGSTLSTFNVPSLIKSCNFQFDVTGGNLQNPPQPGEHGDITGPGLGLPGYTATFDNNPPGHWSITHPVGINDQQARTAVSAFAILNRAVPGVLVNGALPNPPACN